MNCCINVTDWDEMAKKEYVHDNTWLMEELQQYASYGEACDDHPWIEDVLTGVCHLDLGGNTRPLRRQLIWVLMAHQPTITTSVIMEATGKSLSHSKKIVGMVRIACRAVEKELRKTERVGNKAHTGKIWRND